MRAAPLATLAIGLAGAVAASAGGCGLDIVGAASGDAGWSDSAPATSSGSPSPCVGAPESCTDGIDNDCNGRTDCDDAACSATHACVPQVDDWTVVAIVGRRGAGSGTHPAPACPAGFTNPRAGIVNPRAGAATCSCSCGVPPGNPCQQGTLALKVAPESGGCNGNALIDATGACLATSALGATVNRLSGPAPAPAKLACKSDSKPSPLVDDGALELCDLEPGANAGICASGACVARPEGAQVCLTRPGAHVCPTAGLVQQILTRPETIVDTRSCTDCACTTNATACAASSVTLYDDAACTLDPRVVPITTADSCTTIPPATAPPSTHYKFTSTPNATGCSAAAAGVPLRGGAVTTTPFTLCCPP